MDPKRILVLTDGKAGHENQSKAFARALGGEIELVPVRFKSKLAKALSYLLDRLGVRTTALLDFTADPFVSAAEKPYAAVLGTGSGTFYAAKAAAKRLGTKCGVVLYPRGYDLGSFDCVLAPAFDRPAAAANVIPVPANLVASDAAFYEKGVTAFAEHYAKTTGRPLDGSAPSVAVIVGGPNRCATLNAAWLKGELDRLFAEHPASGGVRHWVTTSRRTPPEVEALVDAYPWDYKLVYSRDRFNPIPAFVKLAGALYVTAESTGMLSEACTCGTAEVHALDNLSPGPHKFRRFVEDLRAGGYVDGNRKIDLSAEFARARQLLGFGG